VIFAAPRRPASLLDAERGDGNQPRFWRHDEADGQHAVLLAPFHDVAGLNENLLIAGVLDLQFIDAASLDHLDAALCERLGQGQRNGPIRALAMDEVDGKVLVHVRAGHPAIWVGEGGAARSIQCRKCRDGQGSN
jgi:hypothetical protein